jgi:DNA adenine methylase
LSSLFKHHCNKNHIKDWLIEKLPADYKNFTYIEPYCGTAAVLLNKIPSQTEIINDEDKGIILIFKIIRDQIDQFIKQLKKIKYTKKTFETAITTKDFSDELSHAVNEFVLRRLSKDGFKKSFLPCKSANLNIKSLLEISSTRLRDIYIFNESPIKVLQMFNNSNSIVYANPAPLPEFTEDSFYEAILNNHIHLADVLKNFKGKVLLSGQPSRLHNKLYKGWRCEKKEVNAKVELLWMNF